MRGSMAMASWRRLLLARTFLIVVLTVLARGQTVDEGGQDDILDTTNSDAEGYSTTSCARYICPKYKSELKRYLQAGCVGDFSDYLPDGSSTTGEVTITAALFLGGCSFIGAFLAGVLLGRNYKPDRLSDSEGPMM